MLSRKLCGVLSPVKRMDKEDSFGKNTFEQPMPPTMLVFVKFWNFFIHYPNGKTVNFLR